jgi:hypothetical protein
MFDKEKKSIDFFSLFIKTLIKIKIEISPEMENIIITKIKYIKKVLKIIEKINISLKKFIVGGIEILNNIIIKKYHTLNLVNLNNLLIFIIIREE